MGKFDSIGTVQPYLRLHEGVWADVYKAYDVETKQQVLLKKLKSEYVRDEKLARQFEDEIRLMSRVSHENVVQVLNAGRTETTLYFVAEFIEGRSLKELLEIRALPPLHALFVLYEVAKGLEAAHNSAIFHRDIKPANILISVEGAVKITDFGMASLLDDEVTEEVRGTLGYIAPELIFEGEPGPSSDLFALGATFYEMLTGKPAFRGAASSEIFEQILNHDPVPYLEANPVISNDIVLICRTLLEKKKEARFKSTGMLLEHLSKLSIGWDTAEKKEELIKFVADPQTYETPQVVRVTETSVYERTSSGFKRISVGFSPKWLYGGVLLILIAVGAFLWEGFSQGEQQVPPDRLVEGESIAETYSVSPQMNADDVRQDSLDAAVNLNQSPVQAETMQPSLDSASSSTELNRVLESSDLLINTDSIATNETELEGQLSIICTPFCDVIIDDSFAGSAPPLLTFSLTAGSYRLVLANPRLPSYETEVAVTPGMIDTLKVALAGTLEISVLPWATVFIDDIDHGLIPPTKNVMLSPGRHHLKLVHDSLGVWRDTVNVVAGENHAYGYNLNVLLNK